MLFVQSLLFNPGVVGCTTPPRFCYKFILKIIIAAEEKLIHLLRTTPPSFDGKKLSKGQLIKTFVTGMGRIDALDMF